MRSGEFSREVSHAVASPIFTRAEVLERPCPVPRSAGLYCWWFQCLPIDLDLSGCIARGGRTLLYTGISPKRPPLNGRPASRQTLRERV